MTPIFIDIETLQQEPEEFMVRGTDELHPPKTYKKPEAIAKWKEETLASQTEDLRLDSSLEPILGGTVVVVGIAIGDRPVVTMVAPTLDEEGERELLVLLEKGLAKYNTEPMVTWRGFRFDFPFLGKRALRHGLYGLARYMWREKKWGDKLHVDLAEIWKFHEPNSRGRSREVAQFLGLPVDPEEIDGSQVTEAIQRGEIDKVKTHCAADVERLRQVYWRMRAAGWVGGDDSLPDELPVRPPRVPERTALLRACADLQVQLDKGSIKTAAEAANIPWTGNPPNDDGPQITDLTTTAQLRAYLEALRARAAA